MTEPTHIDITTAPKQPYPLEPYDIVQVSPNYGNSNWQGCLVVVTEVKNWGIKGYVILPGDPERPAAPAYVRIETGGFEHTGGRVEWALGDPPS